MFVVRCNSIRFRLFLKHKIKSRPKLISKSASKNYLYCFKISATKTAWFNRLRCWNCLIIQTHDSSAQVIPKVIFVMIQYMLEQKKIVRHFFGEISNSTTHLPVFGIRLSSAVSQTASAQSAHPPRRTGT